MSEDKKKRDDYSRAVNYERSDKERILDELYMVLSEPYREEKLYTQSGQIHDKIRRFSWDMDDFLRDKVEPSAEKTRRRRIENPPNPTRKRKEPEIIFDELDYDLKAGTSRHGSERGPGSYATSNNGMNFY